jgi:GNAT superfamily N-acetyltransferase
MNLVIREGRSSDHALVIDSIVQTYRASPHAQGASNAALASLVEPLLAAPDSHWRLAVAHPEDDDDTILGFILFGVGFRVPTIGWVHVRGPFRRHGIGRVLLRHALGDQLPREVHVAFLVQRVDDGSPSLVDVARRHGVNVRFRPYLPIQAALDFVSKE